MVNPRHNQFLLHLTEKWQIIGLFLEKAAWWAMLVALPVTSFPYLPKAIGGEALVRPLSLYPVLFLVPFSVIPRMIKRPIPKNILILLLFVLVAIGASMLSLLRGIEPALGISVDSRVLRGIVTLGIGCAFFITVALLPETREDLRFSLRAIYTGISLAMVWGSLQAFNILVPDPAYFAWLEMVQKRISIRPLKIDRISGMTYEPHWFAEQIILLLVPYALAAVFHNVTVFRWRWRRLTIEMLLLGWAIVLLPFTFSRAGLLNLVVLTTLAVLLLRPRPVRRIIEADPLSETQYPPDVIAWNEATPPNVIAKNEAPPSDVIANNEAIPPDVIARNEAIPPDVQYPPASQRSWIVRLAEIGALAILVLAPIYIIGSKNPFFARIWEYWQNPKEHSLSSDHLIDYLSYIGFDARLIYAQAAYHTYLAYPLLGVGLGNYAFYFEEMLPYRAIAEVPEVLSMITPIMGRDRLITAKNFPLRILAETGILGGITFMVFLMVILGYALYLWLSPEKEWQYWGAASLCGLIAFSISSITFDSFVIPNMWILLGLVTAATRISTRRIQNTWMDQSKPGLAANQPAPADVIHNEAFPPEALYPHST